MEKGDQSCSRAYEFGIQVDLSRGGHKEDDANGDGRDTMGE